MNTTHSFRQQIILVFISVALTLATSWGIQYWLWKKTQYDQIMLKNLQTCHELYASNMTLAQQYLAFVNGRITNNRDNQDFYYHMNNYSQSHLKYINMVFCIFPDHPILQEIKDISVQMNNNLIVFIKQYEKMANASATSYLGGTSGSSTINPLERLAIDYLDQHANIDNKLKTKNVEFGIFYREHFKEYLAPTYVTVQK